MSLTRLGQFALPVSNADASEAFYAEILGLKKLYRFDNLVFFDCDGVRLMLEAGDGPVGNSDGICHYFRTDDIDRQCAELKGLGLDFTQDPHLIVTMPDHELWMAFFSDPDGHNLALMEEREL